MDEGWVAFHCGYSQCWWNESVFSGLQGWCDWFQGSTVQAEDWPAAGQAEDWPAAGQAEEWPAAVEATTDFGS